MDTSLPPQQVIWWPKMILDTREGKGNYHEISTDRWLYLDLAFSRCESTASGNNFLPQHFSYEMENNYLELTSQVVVKDLVKFWRHFDGSKHGKKLAGPSRVLMFSFYRLTDEPLGVINEVRGCGKQVAAQ